MMTEIPDHPSFDMPPHPQMVAKMKDAGKWLLLLAAPVCSNRKIALPLQ
jgi:hypothetical protein